MLRHLTPALCCAHPGGISSFEAERTTPHCHDQRGGEPLVEPPGPLRFCPRVFEVLGIRNFASLLSTHEGASMRRKVVAVLCAYCVTVLNADAGLTPFFTWAQVEAPCPHFGDRPGGSDPEWRRVGAWASD